MLCSRQQRLRSEPEGNQSAASEFSFFTGSTGAQATPAAFPWLLLPAQIEGVMEHASILHEQTTPLYSPQHLLWA